MGRKPNKEIEINEKIKYFTRLQNEIKKMKKKLHFNSQAIRKINYYDRATPHEFQHYSFAFDFVITSPI